MKRALGLGVVLLLIWSCEDESTAPPTTTTTTTSTGGMGGMGGADGGGGNTGGDPCPMSVPDQPIDCHDVDHTCQYGTTCCICTNITCAIVWECADPSMNDAACPPGPPVTASMCTSPDVTCDYCTGNVPQRWTCSQGAWAEADIVGCA